MARGRSTDADAIAGTGLAGGDPTDEAARPDDPKRVRSGHRLDAHVLGERDEVGAGEAHREAAREEPKGQPPDVRRADGLLQGHREVASRGSALRLAGLPTERLESLVGRPVEEQEVADRHQPHWAGVGGS